jgi:hypothetical protein
MRENRLYGSVRGVPGNRHSYRDPDPWGDWRATAGSTRKCAYERKGELPARPSSIYAGSTSRGTERLGR